jgi:hypothetical protein
MEKAMVFTNFAFKIDGKFQPAGTLSNVIIAESKEEVREKFNRMKMEVVENTIRFYMDSRAQNGFTPSICVWYSRKKHGALLRRTNGRKQTQTSDTCRTNSSKQVENSTCFFCSHSYNDFVSLVHHSHGREDNET